MAPGARAGAAAAGALALGLAALQAFRLGATGETVYRVAQEISTWTASRAQPGSETVGWLVADLEEARARDPRDPNVEELLGGLALRRIERPGFLDEALRHFERAVALRPTSPYAWMSIAAVQYRRGETGLSFQAALRHAADLGPAEPEVQRGVMDLGLATWQESVPATRHAVERAVTGAMAREPAVALQIAERRGRLAVACRHLDDAPRRVDAEWRLLCRSREATS